MGERINGLQGVGGGICEKLHGKGSRLDRDGACLCHVLR